MFLESLGVRIDVVYHSGTRRWIDAAGVVTRDAITWNADGSDSWARFWVFFHIDDPNFITTTASILTEDGDQIITEDGAQIVSPVAIPFIVSGAVSDEIADWLSAIPREWSAAHIDRITVVLLYGEACTVGYPPRLVGDPPNTVTPAELPVFLTIED